MDQQGRDRGAKWLIIVGAVVAGLVVIGLSTEGFGLYGTETAPTADPNPAVSTNR